MRSLLLSSLALTSLLTPVARAQGALTERFTAAERDPGAVAALILDVSARIARGGPDAHALAEKLEPFCRRAFFSPERFDGDAGLGIRVHAVRSGEIPGRIARKYGFGAGLFELWNEGYDERRLQVGQELKLVDLRGAELRLEVDRARFRVAAWRRTPGGRGWILMAYLPAGLGAELSPTPLGRTRITDRVRNPSWTHPETGVTYAPDHAENVLGGYWMRLDHEGLGESGIGFHGYTKEAPRAWLGKRASNGCVRLLQADMRRLFHLASKGTPVTIRDGSSRPG